MKADQLYLFKEAKSHKSHSRMANKVHVRGHRRRNGSYVREHWRSRPNRRFGTFKRINSTEEQLSFVVNSDTSD
ncbi:hypothetical protein F4X88_12345 [Candidatus Poribacteria bacterium]|jgi:hypothetical protein|nr:hypothetical protein [Candidatus Poribacteria bacterium]MDE0689293.1 hypothetical protein [Candidatus Poribacteria bacterium]MXV83288.1 hypothetical protein [Candidatus Poribacteria bacterium]MYA57080.1 hypothetical protein [Candidatus Poribacteria bacterium]